MDQRDQAQAPAINRSSELRLLPSGSFFGRPYQYIAAEDDEGPLYIRLPINDWKKIVREATTAAIAAEWVQEVAIAKGEIGRIVDGKRIIDLYLAV